MKNLFATICSVMVMAFTTFTIPLQTHAATHTVEKKETWYSIAQQYGLDTQELASANGRTTNDFVKYGESLVIPDSTSTTNSNGTSAKYTVQKNDTWYSISSRYGITVEALAEANGRTANEYVRYGETLTVPTSTATSTTSRNRTHLVQKCQTWRSIAAKYGLSPYDLAMANGRTIEDFVYTGETLVVPTSSSVNTDAVHSFSVTLCTSTGTNSWYNIQLAAETLDGMTLNPGKSFSWHSYMGWCNKEKGYKESTIYMNGKVSKASGGGICFVSTTLMQAARGAGCVITEKHDHSLPVKYAGRGNEAAVSWGGKNLRFYNPSSTTTLKFSVSTNGNTGACTITCAPV